MSREKSAFNPAVMLGVVLAGIVSFAAFLALAAWGGDSRARGDGRAHSLSVAATGFKALADLTANFREVRFVRDEAGRSTEGLLIVTLEAGNSQEEVRDLLRQRRGRPTLLVLPKWTTAPDRQQPGWVRNLGPGQSDAGDRLLGPYTEVKLARTRDAGPPVVVEGGSLDGARFVRPQHPQVITGDSVEPLVELSEGGTLVGRLGDDDYYVVADPDLLNNQGLRDREAAAAALALIASLSPDSDAAVQFDILMNGFGANRSLLRTMLEPPFLAMTLALVAAALLAGFHGAVRFGPQRRSGRAIALGKTALVENSAALIRLARREARLGGAYADLVREDAARAGAAPASLNGEQLDAYLDRFAPPDRPRFSALAANLRNARDTSGLMAAARALFRWRKDMLR